MKNCLFLLSLLVFYLACDSIQTPKEQEHYDFSMRSYVEIGKVFDSIKAPYILDFKNGQKRVVFVGCEHQADTNHRQFLEIERLFEDLKPQITFNEGGQVADSVHFANRNEAIKKDGESSILKYLSDKIGIKMMNGDLPDSLDFKYTLQRHSKEEMWLYYVIERGAIPYRFGNKTDKSFETRFNYLVENYFVKRGFPLKIEEKSFDYFKNLYKKYIGVDFDINNFDVEAFDYVNDNCKFCAIGRTSKVIRDSVLLTKIDKALNQYDRVMVTYGHGHALAVEPALKTLVEKKRN